MRERNYKGKSLLEFKNDYICIDIETTGLSPHYDSIIEVSAIKIKNNQIIDTFTSLIHCDCVCDFITELTGITNEMLADAPDLESVLNKFYDFIGDSVLVGHNVNFDINFLYDNLEWCLGKHLSNDFVDTMRISRLMHKELKSHTLAVLKEYYAAPEHSAHRAEADCLTTIDLFNALRNDFDTNYEVSEITDLHKKRVVKSFRAKDIVSNNSEIDFSNPMYNKEFVFTGKLDTLTRKEAMQIVCDNGGINKDCVTRNTSFLVLGNNDYCKSIKDGKSSKQKKAEKCMLEGQDISIITEDVFLDMIE